MPRTAPDTTSFAQPPEGCTLQLNAFRSNVPQAELDGLKSLLRLSRIGKKTRENTHTTARGMALPVQETEAKDTQRYGVEHSWMTEMRDKWLQYDWRESERYINSFPQFLTDITIPSPDGSHENTYTVHFAALFAPNPSAGARKIPIILTHGWPGSFLEFLPLLHKLANQYAGDPNAFPYHIIIPSMPGYAWSTVPTDGLDRDMNLVEVAELFDALMCGLGFGTGYVAQGGDIGARVSRLLAVKYEACKGAHLNFCHFAQDPDPNEVGPISEEDKKLLERMKHFEVDGRGYIGMHSTRPSTIGFTVGSNPISLLAWIGEKFVEWPEVKLADDTILESLSLYWLTDCYATSIYSYRNNNNHHSDPSSKILKPKHFAYSLFPFDLMPCIVPWVKLTGDLEWFKVHHSGGHFPAMEKTNELWADVEEWLSGWWSKEEC